MDAIESQFLTTLRRIEASVSRLAYAQDGRDQDHEIIRMLRTMLENQDTALANQETIMAAIDDLNAVVAKVQADVQTAITLLQSSAHSQDPQIKAATDALTAVDASLEAAFPPPAVTG